MEDNKIHEAIKLLSEGDKATEKSWFKKPEWYIAGQKYERAATTFKAAHSYEQAIQAYQKASDALFKADSLYLSAKAMESSANLANQQLKQPERAAEMYKKASDIYLAHMVPDRAGEMLEKGARALEPVNVNAAIEMYVTACILFESEDCGRFAIDTFKRTIAIMIRHKRFESAIEMLHRLHKIYADNNNQQGINKTCLSIIIVLLASEDEVEAKKQFQTFCLNEFVRSEESAIASFLLDAFEQGDQELLEKVVRKQIVTFLDNEVVRLARSLQVPGGTYRPPPQPYSQPQQPPPILSQQDQLSKSQNSSLSESNANNISGSGSSNNDDYNRESKEFNTDDYLSSYLNNDDNEKNPATYSIQNNNNDYNQHLPPQPPLNNQSSSNHYQQPLQPLPQPPPPNHQVPPTHQLSNNQTNIETPNKNLVEEVDEEDLC